MRVHFGSTASSSIVRMFCRPSECWRLRAADEPRARRVPRQQAVFAFQGLRRLRSSDDLAKVLGKKLGQREVLLRALSS
jgi:hypothetical protein